ncbi:MAG: adenylylsulfate reductase, partial [Deltaproteobacteria bacterium]|nr:adenylylsulfate reductase [Deltaproteobacteria bacterium]
GPYLLGGHTASGLWVDAGRRSTIAGLYAAGDVAGGAPKKYVSGAWVEGFRAARSALSDLATGALPEAADVDRSWASALGAKVGEALVHPGRLRPEEATERLQTVMDEYAGGISTFYELHGRRLEVAARELEALEGDLTELGVNDLHGLLLATELRDRVLTARALVAHLATRLETRWPGYQTRVDYPDTDDRWACFVNSRMENGNFHVFTRPLQDTGPRS